MFECVCRPVVRSCVCVWVCLCISAVIAFVIFFWGNYFGFWPRQSIRHYPDWHGAHSDKSSNGTDIISRHWDKFFRISACLFTRFCVFLRGDMMPRGYWIQLSAKLWRKTTFTMCEFHGKVIISVSREFRQRADSSASLWRRCCCCCATVCVCLERFWRWM